MNPIRSSAAAAVAGLFVLTIQAAASNSPRIEYNRKAEITINGTVDQVVHHSVGGHMETHLIVLSGGRPLEVHLGPPYFLRWHDFQCRPGQDVEIIASKAIGEPHYLARRIKCGVRTIVLRDERGMPVWKKGQGR